MKSCLLCENREKSGTRRSPAPDVDYVCSSCIIKLAQTPIQTLTEMYCMAIDDGRSRVAYALHSFVPKKYRKNLKIKGNGENREYIFVS